MPQLLALAILLLSTLLYGCASSGNPAVANQELVSQIKLGTSTKDDVRRLLGEPNFVSRSASQMHSFPGMTPKRNVTEIWSYAYTNIQTNPATFIPVVGLFAGSTTVRTDSFAVMFDDQGVVQHITTGHTKATGGPGASWTAQPGDHEPE